MGKKYFFCVLICFLLGIFTSGCLNGDNDNEEALIMTFGALADDYKQEIDNETKLITQYFVSLDEGERVIIQDVIKNISYNNYYDYTGIEFSSLLGERFSIEGDITDDFGPGDTIEIIVHIASVVFSEENPDTGAMWTFEMEVMEEGWDTEDHVYTAVSQEYIRHAHLESKEVAMNFKEFVTDIMQDFDNETREITYWFKSLNEGDTLIISDTIHNIDFKEDGQFSNVEFNSFLGYNFSIEGDITNDFGPGDTVEITLHIMSVVFTDRNIYTNEVWTVKLETIKEGWDDENNEYIPVPQKYISHVSGDGNGEIVLSFNEFVNDYRQNVDNESKIITYWFQSLNEGDTLIMRDTIDTLTYNTTQDYTSIQFISYPGDDFPIEGDITHTFEGGDTVEIRVHIIAVSFTDVHPVTSEIWTVEMETLLEGWDNENKTPKLLPSQYIHLA